MEPPSLDQRVDDALETAERADGVAADKPSRRQGRARARSEPATAAPTPDALDLPATNATLPSADRGQALRILEALLFAASEPLDEAFFARHLPKGSDVAPLIAELQSLYAGRGVNLVRVAGKWAFRTAGDLAYLLERHAVEERRLSKAALETLAIIAYHQPVTRAEIEEIRGVETSKGTIDILLDTGWVRPRARRRAPGKPLTFGTTEQFLQHFGLETVKDLPGLSELRGAGLLDATLPPGFQVPQPTDVAALMPDELPLEDPDAHAQGQLEFDDSGEPEEGNDDEDTEEQRYTTGRP